MLVGTPRLVSVIAGVSTFLGNQWFHKLILPDPLRKIVQAIRRPHTHMSRLAACEICNLRENNRPFTYAKNPAALVQQGSLHWYRNTGWRLLKPCSYIINSSKYHNATHTLNGHTSRIKCQPQTQWGWGINYQGDQKTLFFTLQKNYLACLRAMALNYNFTVKVIWFQVFLSNINNLK